MFFKSFMKKKTVWFCAVIVVLLMTSFFLLSSIYLSFNKQIKEKQEELPNRTIAFLTKDKEDIVLRNITNIPFIIDFHRSIDHLMAFSKESTYLIDVAPKEISIVRGHGINNSNEVLLPDNRSSLEEITLTIEGVETTYQVAGFYAKSNSFTPIYFHKDASKLWEEEEYVYQVVVDTQSHVKAIISDLEQYSYYGNIADQTGQTKLDQLLMTQLICLVFVIVFLVVIFLLVFLMVKEIKDSEKEDIALLKAIGYRDSKICLLVGKNVIGLIFSLLIVSSSILILLLTLFSISISLIYLLICIGLFSFLCVGSIIFLYFRIKNISPILLLKEV